MIYIRDARMYICRRKLLRENSMLDQYAIVSILVAVGIPATLGFIIAKCWKTAWGFGLATSIAAILLCFLMALSVDPESRQDTVVKLVWVTLWMGGTFGLAACFALFLAWYFQPPSAKKRHDLPRDYRDIAYPPKLFNKYDV